MFPDITITGPITIIIITAIITIWKAGCMCESENKGEEKSQESETEKVKDGAKGRRGGPSFPSPPDHDLILLYGDLLGNEDLLYELRHKRERKG